MELFDGEHTHLHFSATSAEAAFYITAQGMDFDDEAWSYQLMAPDGATVYADGTLPAHDHAAGGGHAYAGSQSECHCVPGVIARRGKGRLTLFVQRSNCNDAMWVGQWMLVVARRARDFDGMVMVPGGALIHPVAAAPSRGPRYARLLMRPTTRPAARNVAGPALSALDEAINATNHNDNPTTVVVNVYARTALRLRLSADGGLSGEKLSVELLSDVLTGTATVTKSALRAIAPTVDLRSLLPEPAPARREDPKNNSARQLAKLEAQQPELFAPREIAGELVSHHGGAWHYHFADTAIPGAYHLGVLVRGTYDPGDTTGTAHDPAHPAGDHHGSSNAHAGHGTSANGDSESPSCGNAARLQHFERILCVSTWLSPKA